VVFFVKLEVKIVHVIAQRRKLLNLSRTKMSSIRFGKILVYWQDQDQKINICLSQVLERWVML
jgi:hypothetical protein